MTLLVNWPPIIDDPGTGTGGSPLNAASIGTGAGAMTMKAAIEAAIHSAGNPAITPAAIIDEVVTARGTLGSLDARLDVSINDDGTLKALAAYASTTDVRTVIQGAKNYFPDSLMLIWGAGDAVAPTGWTLTGAGAAIARCGTGLGDVIKMPYGDFCMRITYGAAVAVCTRPILTAAQMGRAGGLVGKKISVGCYARTAIANHARIVVDDGVATTFGGVTGNNSYHSGGGTNEWLYATHTVNAGANQLNVYVEVLQAGAAYFGNFVLLKSAIPPGDWAPERWGKYIVGIPLPGALAVLDMATGMRYRLPFNCMYRGMTGNVQTAPTAVADVVFDVDKTTDLAAWNSPYTTLPDIEVTEFLIDGGVRTAPDGTYAYRCFATGDHIRFNVDQIGETLPGADFTGDLLFEGPLTDLDELAV